MALGSLPHSDWSASIIFHIRPHTLPWIFYLSETNSLSCSWWPSFTGEESRPCGHRRSLAWKSCSWPSRVSRNRGRWFAHQSPSLNLCCFCFNNSPTLYTEPEPAGLLERLLKRKGSEVGPICKDIWETVSLLNNVHFPSLNEHYSFPPQQGQASQAAHLLSANEIWDPVMLISCNAPSAWTTGSMTMTQNRGTRCPWWLCSTNEK